MSRAHYKIFASEWLSDETKRRVLENLKCELRLTAMLLGVDPEAYVSQKLEEKPPNWQDPSPN